MYQRKPQKTLAGCVEREQSSVVECYPPLSIEFASDMARHSKQRHDRHRCNDLAGSPRPATTGIAAAPAAEQGTKSEEGRRLYVGLCAGCHGTEGEGRPHASVPLNTNTTAMLDNPLNLIRIIREGVPEHRLANHERMQAMPACADRLNNIEMAHLVNFLRTRWGSLPANVTSQQIGDIINQHGRRVSDQ